MATIIRNPLDVDLFRADIRESFCIIRDMLEDKNYAEFTKKERKRFRKAMETLKRYVR